MEEQFDFKQIIKNRVSELKNNQDDLNHVISSIIYVFKFNDQHSLAFSKAYKRLLGEKNLGLIQSSEIDVIHQFSKELIFEIVKEVNVKQYHDIILKLEESQFDQEVISNILKIKQEAHKLEISLYFSLNIISIVAAYIFYYFDFNRIEFIPITTQILVIVASILLKRNNAIKTGLLMVLINFTLVLPFNDLITKFDYQLSALLLFEFIVLGLIVSILPKELEKYLKTKFNFKYYLYIATYIPTLIFTILLTLGNIYYTTQMDITYQFNPLYKLMQTIFISIICVQLIEIINND